MEKESKPKFIVRDTTFEDIRPLREMHARSWLATYPNEEEGVPLEWVKEVTDGWLTEEGIISSREHFKDKLGNPDHYHKVAIDIDGEVVGFIHGSRIDGRQRLEGLYLDAKAQGTGLAQEMTNDLMEWFDSTSNIELEVIDYNERAKRFYRKYGFEELPEKNELFKDKIPNVTMIRKG